MPHLLDTGVLLRLFDRADPAFPAIRDCVRRFRREPVRPCVAMQNLAEFWNVTTRPATARGGYGVAATLAEKRLQLVESFCDVLYPSPRSLAEWKRLVVTHSVQGVQVHDASIVAVMLAMRISHVLTLNKADFARYPGVVAQTPDELLASWAAGPLP